MFRSYLSPDNNHHPPTQTHTHACERVAALWRKFNTLPRQRCPALAFGAFGLRGVHGDRPANALGPGIPGHMVSPVGGEAGAQVTCFCSASRAVTDPSLKLAALLTGGSRIIGAAWLSLSLCLHQRSRVLAAHGRTAQTQSMCAVSDVTAPRFSREIDPQTAL